MKRVLFFLLGASLGIISLFAGGEIAIPAKGQSAAAFEVSSPFDPQVSTYAVGDFDYDSKDEVAVDFGTAGIWLYNQGNWIQLAPENPEGLLAWTAVK